MTHELTTSIEIDAPPEQVWAVLIDFDHYDEWNPFMRIVGRANEGATLVVRLMPPGGGESAFEPDVTRSEKNREFGWLGHLVVPGLFDGEHRFRLEPLDDGERTRFEHSETFSGILAGITLRFIREKTEAGFEAMNEALKVRVESIAADEKRESVESV
ncbi:SRPBCC family protein [Haloferax sp. DFSO52]|uniref:SRPBCC family protein n=1 Tax=Haloferax sp. DFSO52 TaxID=3388505 RepID=UPI003A89B516